MQVRLSICCCGYIRPISQFQVSNLRRARETMPYFRPTSLLYITHTIGSEVPIRHWLTLQPSLVYVTMVLRKRDVCACSHYRGQSALGARAPRRVFYNAHAHRIYHASTRKGFFTNVVFVIVTYASEEPPVNNKT